MKLLVTGASGFVGQYVVLEALRRGHIIRAMIRPAASSTGLAWSQQDNVEIVKADLRSKTGLREAVSNVDTVIHLAIAQTGSLYGALAGNVVGTENLLEAMKVADVSRLVLISSFAVYDYMKIRTFGELNEFSPIVTKPSLRDTYRLTKLEQERLVRAAGKEYGLKFTILRPGAIYGKGHTWTARLGVPISDRVWLRVGSWARLPLSYVENCAAAVVLCAESDKAIAETFNVVDYETPTQRVYSNLLKQYLSPSPRIVPVPLTLVRGIARLAWLANQLLFKGEAKTPQVLTPANLHSRFKPLRYNNRRLREIIGWHPHYSLTRALTRCFPNSASKI